MSRITLRDQALDYHSSPIPGKIAIVPTKPCESARDLSLAYSPGVAEPCLEIAKNPNHVYRYTSKGNLVAVITNGTAVLGLGDIGPAAAKPVMEGKGVLFKTFADVDVFDIELQTNSAEQFIETVVSLAPTFGGINLEDIKAPECFFIEEELKKRLDIPVFHDDQHGTAIIASAALLNALEIVGKNLSDMRLVFSGAGAAAVACAKLLMKLGLQRENITMCDSQGVIYIGREEGMNAVKEQFAVKTNARTLEDALKGSDAFFGLSTKGLVTQKMLKSMNADPIVFAMANPDPEISYDDARKAREDVIVATGRSDYPNQVNNVLGFPYIFRGALDVQAKGINDAMILAAVYALAALAKQPVPETVVKAYGNTNFTFGRDYLIPKPFDPRVLYFVAPAVAQAAMRTDMSRVSLDIAEYTLRLKGKLNRGRTILREYYGVARRSRKKRVALPEGRHPKVMKAAVMAHEEGIAEPVLFGNRKLIESTARELDLNIGAFEIIEPEVHPEFNKYVGKYYNMKKRKGVTFTDAERAVRPKQVFSTMMLAEGAVDALICGVDRYYPDMASPILEIIGLKEGVTTAAGMYILSIKDQTLFFADTTINIEMTAEKLANTAILTAEFAKSLSIEPRIAMLSFSNFGSLNHPLAKMVREAKSLVEQQAPQLQVDGELQADTALLYEIMKETYPFCVLSGPANVLIFPDMQSGNIAYKLLQRLGDARVIGPVILGLKKPAYVMQRHASVDEIFNMITVAVAQAALAE